MGSVTRWTRVGMRIMTLLVERYLVSILALTGFLCLNTPAMAGEQYTIRDIGVLETGVMVEGLNNEGQIVGTIPISLTRTHGWWFDGKKIIDFGACGGVGCRVMGINSRAQIVGNIGRDAFIYSDGKFIEISLFAKPPGMALAINDVALVVGWYTLIPHVEGNSTAPSERHAFLYRGRKLTDLGTLGGKESVATAINNSDQVVGYSSTYRDETHAFFYMQDRMIDLGTLGGTESRANSINDKGQVVGSANVAGSNQQHAFLYSDGKMSDLGSLDGRESTALDINQSGYIVGNSGSRGFLYRDGKMLDLKTLLPQRAGWKSISPCCINDRNQIAGIGISNDGTSRIVLLSPTQ